MHRNMEATLLVTDKYRSEILTMIKTEDSLDTVSRILHLAGAGNEPQVQQSVCFSS